MSGLRPFQFDDYAPMHTYKPKRRGISLGRVLLILGIIAALVAVSVFIYYRVKASTFDNAVRGDVQQASNTVSVFLTANPGVTSFDQNTPGLTLKTNPGTVLVITGLQGRGQGLPSAYEIHGWNPKGSAYTSERKYWMFVSTTGVYEAGGTA